ncbi:MAG: OsmC family protein [Acidimicrobiia bacterium]
MIESHEYQVLLTGTDPKTGYLESDEDRLPKLEVATPPEFGGPGETWSPEHLFVAAVSSCLMTTFHAIAQISGLEVLEYHDEAISHLQRGDDRLYRIDRVTVRPRVVIADESKIDKAVHLLEKAEAVCLISRSVSSEIDLHPTVIASHQVDADT